MAYYRICPECGAALDPGEVCDCKKETARSAANTPDGKKKTYSYIDSIAERGRKVKK